MDRNEEYKTLLSELEETPLKLDFTLERALARKRSTLRRRRKAIFAPLGSVVAVLAVFVLLVNVSPTFAYAAGRLPLLRDLARFVAFSPSLSAAVENEYVQPMDLEQSANGITARIEYVIVDQKQLNIFYTLQTETYEMLESSPNILGVDRKALEGFSVLSGDYGAENDSLRKITVDFSQGTMPEALVLDLDVYKSDVGVKHSEAPTPASEHDYLFEDSHTLPETLSTFSFTLRFDPNFTATGEVLALERSFMLDGQKLTLVTAEIYPTHTRLSFAPDSGNTAWLKSLNFYIENEKGERFEGITNGISAYGSIDSPMMATYMLESSFFSDSKHLTLHITGVTWLDKDMARVRLDLKNTTAETLPEGVDFVSAKRYDDSWLLEFTATQIKENNSYQVWDWNYYDAEGQKYAFTSMSSTSAGATYSDGNKAEENLFGVRLPLKDYPYDEVWLCPSFSRRVILDTPVSLEIK